MAANTLNWKNLGRRSKGLGAAFGLALLLGFPASAAYAAQQERHLQPKVQQLENRAPKRVLFVGNSYLYYNDSLHNHLLRIAAEIGPHGPAEYQYKSATISGARLSHHDIDSLLAPGRLGIEEPFDLVILQGGSREVLTEADRAGFHAQATELSGKVRATGAEVALYMIHAYVEPHELQDAGMFDKIRATYLSTGNALNALVIPVGLAFERAFEERPDSALHKTFDGTHPSMLGTYLAACVLYQSIYGKSVVGIAYDYFGEVPRDAAEFLQRIADQTVREFYGRTETPEPLPKLP